MIKQRICALSGALLLILGCTGCAPLDFFFTQNDNSAASVNEHKELRYDTEAVKQRALAMQDLFNTADMDARIQSGIEELLADVDKAYAIYVHAEMDYYADWNNKDLSLLSSQTYSDYCVVNEIVSWIFTHGSTKSRYCPMFRPYVDEEWSAYYLATPLNRVITSARSDAASTGELLDQYYDTAYDSSLTPEDIPATNHSCAQLYLDTLKRYDTKDCLYGSFARDYKPEQASAAYEYIAEHFVPIYRALYEQLLSDPRFDALDNGEFGNLDAYETLREYAPKLSPEIAESVEKLFSQPYFRSVSGTGCYDGSYTVELASEHTALMYTYLNGTYYDLTTVVHEFGHFHADWRSATPILITQNCTDLAEVQSQGMEMLFTQFYDALYSENSRFMELITLYGILDSVISGFAIGEFERDVMTHIESYKAEDVADSFAAIAENTLLGRDLFEISHLFEQPGYYISYGVSALAALELYTQMQSDPAAASEMYAKISARSSTSGEHLLVQSLAECGFSDIFDETTLVQISDVLKDRITALSE